MSCFAVGSIKNLNGTWLKVKYENNEDNYRCHYKPSFPSEQSNLTGIQQVQYRIHIKFSSNKISASMLEIQIETIRNIIALCDVNMWWIYIFCSYISVLLSQMFWFSLKPWIMSLDITFLPQTLTQCHLWSKQHLQHKVHSLNLKALYVIIIDCFVMFDLCFFLIRMWK